MSNTTDIAEVSETNSKSALRTFGGYVPRSLEEWMQFSKMIANSELCPAAYRGKAETVFIACQMGADLGLKPMQAIQNIAVIKGRPCLWGDAALAVCRGHAEFENIEEEIDGDVAVCTVYRRGNTPVRREFSIQEAKLAGLLNNSGPWQTYPKRMLQMRARGFALRDSFPDALRGINLAEEVQDYPLDEKTTFIPKTEKVTGSSEFKNLSILISESTSLEEIEEHVPRLQLFAGASHEKAELRRLYKEKIELLRAEDIQEEMTKAEESQHEHDTLPTE